MQTLAVLCLVASLLTTPTPFPTGSPTPTPTPLGTQTPTPTPFVEPTASYEDYLTEVARMTEEAKTAAAQTPTPAPRIVYLPFITR